VSLGRIAVAWLAVSAWLLGWQWVERRARMKGQMPGREAAELTGEALVTTLFGALWFASLGAGAWWLVFLLVGALREWPPSRRRGALRILRVIGAGGLLAWVLPA
jgi:hypothetical protein